MKAARLTTSIVLGVLFACVTFSSGCARNPYETKIKADSPEVLASWVVMNTHQLSAKEIEEINSCLNEVKIAIMILKLASGSEGISELQCRRINGMKLKEVLVLGYELKQKRLRDECAVLEQDYLYKTQLRTRKGDTESAEYLNQQREVRLEELQKFATKIHACQTRLAELRTQFELPEKLKTTIDEQDFDGVSKQYRM